MTGKKKSSGKKSQKTSKRKKGVSKKKVIKRQPLSWKVFALLFGAGFLAFFPVLFADFVGIDDQKLILDNMTRFDRAPGEIFTASLFNPHYKPLIYGMWYLEYKLFGLSPFVYHFNNLLFHCINMLLAFVLLRKLCTQFETTRKNADYFALFAALLFGLHPLHVESVAWAIERKDMMYTLFFLLSMLAYIRFITERTGKAKWMIASVILFFLSTVSKSPAIVLPFVLLLVDRVYSRKFNLQRITEKLPHWIVMVMMLALYGVFSSSGSEGEIGNLLSTRPVSTLDNLVALPTLYGKFILLGIKSAFWYLHSLLPFHLSIAYPKSMVADLGGAVHVFVLIVPLIGYLMYRFRNHKLFFFTHAFFFVTLALALVRTGIGRVIWLSDRYVYLSVLGLVLFYTVQLVNFMLKRGLKRRHISVALGALCVVFAASSFLYSRQWKDSETLWNNVIRKYPTVHYAYVDRGGALKNQGDLEGALRDFDKSIALEESGEAYIQRGTVYRQQKKLNEALSDYLRAVELEPGNPYAYNNIGNVYFTQGNYQEAIKAYGQALGRQPINASYLTNRAAANYSLGRYDVALVDLDKAEIYGPNYLPVFKNRAIIYEQTRNYQGAYENYRRASELRPSDETFNYSMGTMLRKLKRNQEAIDQFSQAISKNPRRAIYYRSRAEMYDLIGNAAAAARDRASADGL